MYKKLLACTALSALFVFNSANADSETNINHVNGEEANQTHNHHYQATPDSHAPIGVMGDHKHGEGEVMLSYRNMNMLMKGMKDGDSRISPSEVTSATGSYGYMMTPTRMSMNMHMIGAMYGVSNDLTLMVMGNYIQNDMNMVNRAGVRSKMSSEGFGDTSVSGLYSLWKKSCNCGTEKSLHANIGLSLPTGSTDEKGIRMGAYGNLPYAMQLGSGTYDPILGLTYSSISDSFSWGAQAKAKFRIGENDEDYRRGNEYKVTSWIAKNVTDFASLSLRVEGKSTGDISGADQNTIGLRAMVPTFDPNNYGGEVVNLGIGFNLLGNEGPLKNHRLAFEYIKPVYENLNGPQMSTEHIFTIGWQWNF